jgi:uncharacterized membrane protein YfcA
MTWWLIYLAMGLGVGVFAGMLGIGGGTILVTLMVLAFHAQGIAPDRILHLALGTAMATVILTSISSFLAHNKHGAVRWDIVRSVAPGLVAGAVVGALIAEKLPTRYLALIFVVFVLYAGTQLILDVKPKASRQLPDAWIMAGVAMLVGVTCSLVGAAGGIITIPLLSLCNVPLRQAIGTSSAFGLPVAVAGTFGYVWSGLGDLSLPAFTLGYVYIPALLAIVAGTFVTVPVGARLTHRMPVLALKRILGVILWMLAAKMTWTLL